MSPASLGSLHAPNATPCSRSTSASICASTRSAQSGGVQRITLPNTSNPSMTPACRIGLRKGSISSFSLNKGSPPGRTAVVASDSSVTPKHSSG